VLEYAIKRLLLFIPTLLGIVILNFVVIQFVPGGPIEQAVAKIRYGEGGVGGQGEAGRGGASVRDVKAKGIEPEQIEYLRKLYGFDEPVLKRLVNWTWRLFTFQFGDSYYHHRAVVDIIKEKLPVSASLGIISFFLTYIVCVPLGVMKAVRHGSKFDLSSSVVILIGYSLPGFVLGVFMMVLFGGGRFWDILPLRGLVSDNFASLSPLQQFFDYVHHLIMPIICMTISSFAVLTLLTKNSVLDNVQQQYVLTARAKGVEERWVIWKHVFRNSLIPLVTGVAGSFLTMFFSEALLIEKLFSLDGLGLLAFDSVMSRDYPIVMANLFFMSLLFIIGNLLSDILYVIVDPRINFEQLSRA
jgi:microcin C transport system permease protein